MIGRLRCTLAYKRAPQLMVDVAGVGYEVEAPMSTFYALPETGGEVVIHTHMVVREDAHLLFGFATEAERSFFRELIKVNGVGAKMGLTILSGMSVDAFAVAIRNSDVAMLVRLPGVGKKTAERLIVEMRDKVEDRVTDPAAITSMALLEVEENSPVNDAVSALVALGYKPQEASRMVRNVKGSDLPSEEIIRQALKAAAS
jgi:Holliday junction DNA helicase RuvA